ncbi:small polypeptide DEVIL 11 [Amaranthus tricolor]|uniref:small polypeptide DEVIL 11 n=1 Tax=Amaranthus tricolor TaxID=29722 RepID=UPI002587C1FE|nr:small polypeptide DEVIL 11 [Amaranthus tricolor]
MIMASEITFSSTKTPISTNSTIYFDEKWKLSKKDGSNRRNVSTRSSSSSSFLSGNSSNKRCAFSRKCARLVKEQRARFYIMRRCVVMLICWRDYGDNLD